MKKFLPSHHAAGGPLVNNQEEVLSKFFVIVVEDTGDENKFYSDPDRFMASTKIELPTECEFRGCLELSDSQAQKLLRDVV